MNVRLEDSLLKKFGDGEHFVANARMNSRLLCNVSEHIEVTLDQIFLKQFHEFYSFLCGQHNNTCNQYN